MSSDQKYIIKYSSMKFDPTKNLYWFKDLGEWITDPTRATQFSNPEGITEVGRLLVEHEWVTRLIPAEEISKTKPASPPNGFILVVDCDGDPQEVFSGNVTFDHAFKAVHRLDKLNLNYSPHSAWMWNSERGEFFQIFDRVGK